MTQPHLAAPRPDHLGQRHPVTASGDPGLAWGTELEAEQVAECLGREQGGLGSVGGRDPLVLSREGEVLANQELDNLELSAPQPGPRGCLPSAWPSAPVVPTASLPAAPQAFSTGGLSCSSFRPEAWSPTAPSVWPS